LLPHTGLLARRLLEPETIDPERQRRRAPRVEAERDPVDLLDLGSFPLPVLAVGERHNEVVQTVSFARVDSVPQDDVQATSAAATR